MAREWSRAGGRYRRNFSDLPSNRWKMVQSKMLGSGSPAPNWALKGGGVFKVLFVT